MILIGVAWLLIVAIALYQSLHGMFSALIMAVLTTICAVFALGTYEWLGPAFLYASQPAYADALSLTLHFVLPLLALRIAFDKFVPDNAPLGARSVDRAVGGVLGLYAGVVMVGVLVIILQMLPWGAGVFGYTPYDSSLQRNDRVYCDEFALGLFKASAGLASSNSFTKVHDDLLLELFCARNTSGLNGRVDTPPTALAITEACKPTESAWKRVGDYAKLPKYPGLEDEKTDIVVIKATVSNKVRSDRKEDGWYRLPATHFRIVTGAGRSFYPLGYLKDSGKKWDLIPAKMTDGKVHMTALRVLREFKTEAYQEIAWVYRVPRMPEDTGTLDDDAGLDDEEINRRKADREALYAPSHMIFRRTSRTTVPLVLLPDMPKTPKEVADAAAIEAAKKKAKSRT